MCGRNVLAFGQMVHVCRPCYSSQAADLPFGVNRYGSRCTSSFKNHGNLAIFPPVMRA